MVFMVILVFFLINFISSASAVWSEFQSPGSYSIKPILNVESQLSYVDADIQNIHINNLIT